MSKNKKPRKAYKPRPKALVNMDVAVGNCALLSKATREAILKPCTQAITHFREGRADVDQPLALITAIELLKRVEAINLVTEMESYLAEVTCALNAIIKRGYRGSLANGWTPPTLYAHELDALNLLHTLFDHALKHASKKQMRDIDDYIHDRAASEGRKLVHFKEAA